MKFLRKFIITALIILISVFIIFSVTVSASIYTNNNSLYQDEDFRINNYIYTVERGDTLYYLLVNLILLSMS